MLIMGNKKGELKSNYLIIRVRVSEVGSKQPSPPSRKPDHASQLVS